MSRRRIHKRMYAVSKNGVGVIAGTMAYSRRAAINCFLLNAINVEPDSWERFKRAGYRTVVAQIKIMHRQSPQATTEPSNG
jgi:uridine kinase